MHLQLLRLRGVIPGIRGIHRKGRGQAAPVLHLRTFTTRRPFPLHPPGGSVTLKQQAWGAICGGKGVRMSFLKRFVKSGKEIRLTSLASCAG